jgi:hypothetical protein
VSRRVQSRVIRSDDQVYTGKHEWEPREGEWDEHVRLTLKTQGPVGMSRCEFCENVRAVLEIDALRDAGHRADVVPLESLIARKTHRAT